MGNRVRPPWGSRRAAAGAGLFSTAFAFSVFVIFLLFATQVLFGLYARTTVTSVAADLAQRAAAEGPALDEHAFRRHAAEARARLGGYGDDARFDFRLLDGDGDGSADTVAVRIRADLPVLTPVRWTGFGPGTFTRTVRARLEIFQQAPA